MRDQTKTNNEGGERSFHLDEHLIIDFLLGCLSQGENEKILQHLAECPACEKLFQRRAAESERFTATKVLRFLPDGELVVEKRGTAVRADGGEKEKNDLWNYFSSKILNIWNSLHGGFRQPRFQLAGGLAAVAALLLIVWFHSARTPDTPHLYMLRPYSFQLQSRDALQAAPSDDLKAGLNAYGKEDFKRAIELLQRTDVPEQAAAHETIRKVYLGSALAWNGDYEEAIEILETVPFPLVPPEWSREAHWTLYVAFKESGREQSADSLIKILSGKSGEVGERARRLLKK
jgi:hypothetical protein